MVANTLEQSLDSYLLWSGVDTFLCDPRDLADGLHSRAATVESKIAAKSLQEWGASFSTSNTILVISESYFTVGAHAVFQHAKRRKRRRLKCSHHPVL